MSILVLSAMCLLFTACQSNEDKEKNQIHNIMLDKAEHQELQNSQSGITLENGKETVFDHRQRTYCDYSK